MTINYKIWYIFELKETLHIACQFALIFRKVDVIFELGASLCEFQWSEDKITNIGFVLLLKGKCDEWFTFLFMLRCTQLYKAVYK